MTRAAVCIRFLVVAACVATCIPSAAFAATPPRTIAPLDRQTSDEQIAHDRAAIAAWASVLDTLPAARADAWRATSARHWLRAARAEYDDNDRTGFPQASFGRAVGLIGELTAGQSAVTSETVPSAVPPHGSLRVADTLYVEIEQIKRSAGFECAKEELAELEVELAWAGNEQLDQGDCKSSPHFARALDLIHAARLKAGACGPVETPVAVHETPAPAPAPLDTVRAPVPALPTREELKIPMNVHFALAKHDVGSISRQVIRGIADILIKYPSITVRLDGHTDSRGNAEYNLALSRRRVNAVRDAMLAMGVDDARISTEARGKEHLYATEADTRGFALNRRVEMTFVDHEGRDIEATRQESDVQIEAERKVAPKKPAAKRPAPRRTTTRSR